MRLWLSLTRAQAPSDSGAPQSSNARRWQVPRPAWVLMEGRPPPQSPLWRRMDPITRRHVWDVIQAAKADRCVVLTTHRCALPTPGLPIEAPALALCLRSGGSGCVNEGRRERGGPSAARH